MARRKSNAVDAPQTLAEATLLLNEYARIEALISQLSAEREAGFAKLQADYQAMAAPLGEQLGLLFKQIKPWYEANRAAMTLDSRKSVKIGGCEIGHRIGNPTLKLPPTKSEASAIAWLEAQFAEGLSWPNGFIRRVKTLDKAAMIRVLRLDAPSLATIGLQDGGFLVTQREVFFIESAALPGVMTPVEGTEQ